MSSLSLTLPESDAARLAEVAAREGISLEQAAAAAVKSHLDGEEVARREIEAGLVELDAGQGMTLDAYEREMDAFMARLPPARG